jgi:hypothetical protein
MNASFCLTFFFAFGKERLGIRHFRVHLHAQQQLEHVAHSHMDCVAELLLTQMAMQLAVQRRHVRREEAQDAPQRKVSQVRERTQVLMNKLRGKLLRKGPAREQSAHELREKATASIRRAAFALHLKTHEAQESSHAGNLQGELLLHRRAKC